MQSIENISNNVSVPSSNSARRIEFFKKEIIRIEEALKLIEQQRRTLTAEKLHPPRHLTYEEKTDADARIVFVSNVENVATMEALETHFKNCGAINRVSIKKDKVTGNPKGYAYIVFSNATGVSNALLLNDSVFLGRRLKVSAMSAKWTNKPDISTRTSSGRGKPAQVARRGGLSSAARTSRSDVHKESNFGRSGFRDIK